MVHRTKKLVALIALCHFYAIFCSNPIATPLKVLATASKNKIDSEPSVLQADQQTTYRLLTIPPQTTFTKDWDGYTYIGPDVTLHYPQEKNGRYTVSYRCQKRIHYQCHFSASQFKAGYCKCEQGNLIKIVHKTWKLNIYFKDGTLYVERFKPDQTPT